jgi:3-oxoacyl-[acyl-carrier-protein] synthase-3
VYITRLSKFLPNAPVSNNEMEGVLGLINGKPSRARSLVLRNNGIKSRHYAWLNGHRTHNNAQMAALAVKALFSETLPYSSLQLLAAGTSSPAQIQPSHASMVHGELGGDDLEIMSGGGTCCSSMAAMKYAWMAVGCQQAQTAAVCGSECFSDWLMADRFQPEADTWNDINGNPYLAFEKDFLRWMLSDGAAAALLQNHTAPDGLSLRIDWIEITSFAGELETCMYAGAVKNTDGSLKGWNELTPYDWTGQSVFSLKQDTRLLGDNIIRKGGEVLRHLVKKYQLTPENIDYYLPHMSSEYFLAEMKAHMAAAGLPLPPEKWFYNLTRVGNVGSASALLMLEELFHSKQLKKGDRLLVMVPESARFTYSYMHLTVVE